MCARTRSRWRAILGIARAPTVPPSSARLPWCSSGGVAKMCRRCLNSMRRSVFTEFVFLSISFTCILYFYTSVFYDIAHVYDERAQNCWSRLFLNFCFHCLCVYPSFTISSARSFHFSVPLLDAADWSWTTAFFLMGRFVRLSDVQGFFVNELLCPT